MQLSDFGGQVSQAPWEDQGVGRGWVWPGAQGPTRPCPEGSCVGTECPSLSYHWKGVHQP